MTGTILDQIVETKRREVDAARRDRPLSELMPRVEAAAPPRDFYSALVDQPSNPGPIRLIAEVKKASPSAGLIRADFDPVAIAETYEKAGAAALSVLTDRTYFQGELSFIELVKQAVKLPVLRKDFVLDEYQVFESRAAGADAILLIAAIVSPIDIAHWSGLAFEMGMSTLVEVHNEAELSAVLPCIRAERRCLLGVNNRDLAKQKTSLDVSRHLGSILPAGLPFVAESGIATREDVVAVESYGARAMLVGESLMRAPDIGAKTQKLLGHA